jgi:hypothetical protein
MAGLNEVPRGLKPAPPQASEAARQTTQNDGLPHMQMAKRELAGLFVRIRY